MYLAIFAASVLLLLRHYRVAWTRPRRRWLAILAVLAALAVANYTNYSAFHGHGTRAPGGRKLRIEKSRKFIAI